MAIFGRGRNASGGQKPPEGGAQRSRSDEFQEALRQRTGDEKFAKTYRTRGRLYDKIPFSLRTMDIIIYAIVALIVIALIVGIVTGK